MIKRHAAIVGAGIAGLTSALALARKGFAVSIYEQAVELAEVGAGLQLSPNASRLLARLGLVEKLTDKWHEPASIDLLSGLTGRHVAQVPAGAKARERWGAPYAVIHRADLQSVLHQAVLDHHSIELQLGMRLEGAGVEAVRRDIEARSGRLPDLVVGADGVWSRMRASAGGPAKAPFTGQIAWRMTLPRESIGSLFDPDRLSAFIAPQTHLVAYPLKSRGTVNLVAITHGAAMEANWSGNDAARHELSEAFSRWSSRLTGLFDRAEMNGRWPIHGLSGQYWGAGRLVLIGDAAHAMPPYAAQGAAMAIEDAYALASHVAGDDLDAGIAAFIAARRPRIDKVARRAAFNRFAYHARGPIRLGRDIVLALRKPDDLAGDFDWLYGDRSIE